MRSNGRFRWWILIRTSFFGLASCRLKPDRAGFQRALVPLGATSEPPDAVCLRFQADNCTLRAIGNWLSTWRSITLSDHFMRSIAKDHC